MGCYVAESGGPAVIVFLLFSILFFAVGTGILFFIFELLLPALDNTLNQQHILFSQVESGNFELERSEDGGGHMRPAFGPDSRGFRFWSGCYRFARRLGHIFGA